MKFIVMVTLVLSTVGCAGTFGGEHRTTVTVANVTTASVAVAGMALDWCGTHHAAATRHDAWEGGMPTTKVIGTHPSTGVVDAYFAIGTIALAAAAQVVPRRFRWIAYGSVAVAEIVTVHGNLSTTRCGPLGVN